MMPSTGTNDGNMNALAVGIAVATTATITMATMWWWQNTRTTTRAQELQVNDERTKTFTLQDGRKLGYMELGPDDGFPVLYCHGFPCCRYECKLLLLDNSSILNTAGIRLVIPDRPGYGISDWDPNCKQVYDWTKDIKELLVDHLGLLLSQDESSKGKTKKQISILGISGGAPYAAACAHAFGSQVKSLVIVCGMGPANAPGAKDGRSWFLPSISFRFVRRLMLRVMALVSRRCNDPQVMARYAAEAGMAKVDKEWLCELPNHPERAKAFLEISKESFRQGIWGADSDTERYRKPWGFELNEIQHCNTYLWHGRDDENVSVSVGEYVASQIPSCRQTNIIEKEGHFTIVSNHTQDILAGLVQ